MSKDDEEVDVSWVHGEERAGPESRSGWPAAFTAVSLAVLFVVCWLGTLWIRR